MKFLCIHDWKRLKDEPEYDYFDDSGVKIGVFACKCVKCGKRMNRKYYKTSELSEYVDKKGK